MRLHFCLEPKTNNIVLVLDRLRGEIENYQNVQQRQNISWGDPRNPLVILFMLQSEMPSESVRDQFYEKLLDFNYDHGGKQRLSSHKVLKQTDKVSSL